MATMYYNDATGDHLWSTLGNWWTTSPGVGAAASLPAVGDTVLLTGAVTHSSYSATVANLTITNFTLNMNLTVSGSATFAGTAKNAGVVDGTTVFNSTAENSSGANVIGGCTFNTSAKNYGTVTGTTIFNNASTNESGGIIQGGCTFNSTASNKAGANVVGTTVFNSSATCAGSVTGGCTFNSSSLTTSVAIITGNTTFNSTSINRGTVNGTVVFDGSSYNDTTGIINGYGAIFQSSSQNKGTLNCSQCQIFGGASTTSTSLITVTAFVLIAGGDNAGTFAGSGVSYFSTSSTNSGTVNTASCSFIDSATNSSTGAINCSCTFSVSSTNDGTVTADSVIFDDTSTNTGTVNSNDCKIYKNGGNNTGVIVGVGNFYGDAGTGIYSDNVGGTVTGTANAYWPATYPIGGTVTGTTNYIGYNFVEAQCQIGVKATGILGFLKTVAVPPASSNIGVRAVGIVNCPVSVPVARIGIGLKFTGKLTPSDLGFTVSQALSAIFNLWGGGCSDGCDTADTPKGRAALDILNGCLQEIMLNAKELQYLSRETIDVSTATLDANNGLYYYLLPDNVQAVVGPVVLKTVSSVGAVAIRRQTQGVSTKGQLLNFSTYFNSPGRNTIYGYFIERGYQSTGERARVRIYVSTNITDAILRVDVEREALRYRAQDCVNGTVIPLPHQYAESLLLPLLREAASASTYASRRDAYPMYQAAAAAARTRYKMADPQNPALEPEPERKRKP